MFCRFFSAVGLLMSGNVAVAQQAGTLISAEPTQDAPAGAQSWRVHYWTTDETGRPREVTGMVVAPREAIPAQLRRVLAWTHGTTGLEDRCAPSLAPWFYTQVDGLASAIARGYVVVAPDYPGLGGPGEHPYMVGEATARSVLGGVRAAGAIPGAAAGKKFAVWGLSQGGHAELWTGQAARRYAPDLDLVGVAAAAPPTMLAQNLAGDGDPSARAFLTAYLTYSWSKAYSVSLASVGNRSAQGVITRLARNNCIAANSKPRLGTILGVVALKRSLARVDLARVEPWARLMQRNSPTPRPYGVPFLIAQNANDKIVDAKVTRSWARQMCQAGGRVRFIAVRGQGHETTSADSATETLDWIDGRFSRAAPPSNCGKI